MTIQINHSADTITASGGSGALVGFPVNGFKNRIINGAMVIDQRNAGASVTGSGSSTQYSLDRWNIGNTVASKFTAQQSSTAPAGFTKSLLITSSSAYSVSSTDFFMVRQLIEGLNVADLNWGSANAQTVTISFWVRSSLTGTFGGALTNAAYNRSYPFTYTISAANTWEQKTVTIAGDTSGTWTKDNTAGIQLIFSMGTGSTNSGTAGSWSGSNYYSATGATSVVGTSGATFYITGVQLEKGSTATSFDYRPYGTEFALCQRYYEITQFQGWARSSDNLLLGSGGYVQQKRAAPTVTYSKISGNGSGSVLGLAAPNIYFASCYQSVGQASGDCIYQAISNSEL